MVACIGVINDGSYNAPPWRFRSSQNQTTRPRHIVGLMVVAHHAAVVIERLVDEKFAGVAN